MEGYDPNYRHIPSAGITQIRLTGRHILLYPTARFTQLPNGNYINLEIQCKQKDGLAIAMC